MGMSMRVEGIKPANEKYKRMLTVYDACEAAGVPIPDTVIAFFGNTTPDEKGVVIPLGSDYGQRSLAVTTFDDGNCSSGLDVDLRTLDSDIKILRFVVSC